MEGQTPVHPYCAAAGKLRWRTALQRATGLHLVDRGVSGTKYRFQAGVELGTRRGTVVSVLVRFEIAVDDVLHVVTIQEVLHLIQTARTIDCINVAFSLCNGATGCLTTPEAFVLRPPQHSR